jgi:hypothetical protein
MFAAKIVCAFNHVIRVSPHVLRNPLCVASTMLTCHVMVMWEKHFIVKHEASHESAVKFFNCRPFSVFPFIYSILTGITRSDPPTRSYCHAVSRGFLNLRSVGPTCTYAHVMKATLREAAIFVMDTNSDPAFVGRRDKPHFCCFHNTARFLLKKCTEYVNRHH